MYNHQLDTFLTAAELGSFSKAAEKLYITPSAVLQQIKLLEENLGAPLFRRTNHGVALTEAGKILQTDALAMISLSDQTKEHIKAVTNKQKELIRIGTSIQFRMFYLNYFINRYLAEHKDTKIEVIYLTEHPSEKDPFPVIGSTYDVREGIDYTTANEKANKIVLFEDPFSLLIPFKHPFFNKESITYEDLKGQRVMILEKGHNKAIDSLNHSLKNLGCVLIEEPFFSTEVFAYAELEMIPIVTHSIYRTLHNLNYRLIPLVSQHKSPYVLTFSAQQSPAVLQFYDFINKLIGDENVRKELMIDA